MTAPCWATARPKWPGPARAGADVIGSTARAGRTRFCASSSRCARPCPRNALSAMPNAGWPEQVGGRIMYPAAPDYFGEYALAFCEGRHQPDRRLLRHHPAAHRRHGARLESAPAGLPGCEAAVSASASAKKACLASSPPSWPKSWPPASLSSRWRWTRRAGCPPTSCWRAPACWPKPART
jgi:hypothetical protein